MAQSATARPFASPFGLISDCHTQFIFAAARLNRNREWREVRGLPIDAQPGTRRPLLHSWKIVSAAALISPKEDRSWTKRERCSSSGKSPGWTSERVKMAKVHESISLLLVQYERLRKSGKLTPRSKPIRKIKFVM